MADTSLKGEPSKWFFDSEFLQSSAPTIRQGVDRHKELSYRQQAAQFVQDMGQRLQGPQWCLNTAIVYIHRFYVYHSFKDVPRNDLAAAALFLAGKVEEFPRKLEHLVKVSYALQHRDEPPLDISSDKYLDEAQKIVMYENLLLTTLGFDMRIEHPHTHVVKCCQLIKAPRDLAQASYFLATDSLLLTTFCLRFRPTVVACICIYLACKWANWEIPLSQEGRPWFYYVDPSVTEECLRAISEEFVDILKRTPNKLRTKLTSGVVPKISSAHNNSHQKSSKSEAETQGRPDDEHSDFTGNQHEKIIGYNMASVPGAKPQHMQIKSESLTSPARCQTALEEPQVHPASQHEVKPTVSAIPLHQPATKPRPGATSPNSLKRIKTEPGTLNVLDLSAYKELKRAKERVKEQQPVDKSAAEGNGVKPPTSRPSFIPDTSKGGWMTSFADMDSRNSLASAATDSSKTGPPVPHHHHHSSKDAKDKKRSDEERRKYEERKRHMTADLSKDDKKRQKMALPEGMKRNSDLGIAPPQKSESRSGSHHKDELKSGRTSSDNGGNRPNGLLPPVKNGTAGGSHHQPRSSVPSGIASSGNGRPLSNPLKSSAHSTSAKFGFNSPSSKVSGSEPSVNESLRNVSSIQSKSSPMGSQSHRHQSASSGSRSSHSTPQPAISVEALSEANLNEESMDVEDNSLVNLPDENLILLKEKLQRELMEEEEEVSPSPPLCNGSELIDTKPTGGQSQPYSPATGQSLKSRMKMEESQQQKSSPMTSFGGQNHSDPHGIQFPTGPIFGSNFMSSGSFLAAPPPPPPPSILPPLPPSGDVPPPPPPPI